MNIQIYGDITLKTAQNISQMLRAKPTDSVQVDINSPGGDAHAALSLYNDLVAHKGSVLIRVTGIAASAATVVCCAGFVEAAENALLMIHAPWVQVVGNAHKLREDAEVLEKHHFAMVKIYSQKMRKGERALLASYFDGKDHWFSAEEAKAIGLVDRIVAPLKIAAEFKFGALQCPTRFQMPEVQNEYSNTLPPTGISAAHSTLSAPYSGPSTTIMAAADIAGACVSAGEPALIQELLSRPYTTVEIQQRLQDAKTIRTMAARLHMPERAEFYIQNNINPNAVGKDLWALDVARDQALKIDTSPRISMGHSYGGHGATEFVDAAQSALLMRMGIPHNIHPAARDLAGTSIMSMAEIILDQSGRLSKGHSPTQTIQSALTSSDFPNLISSTINHALTSRFETISQEHRSLVTVSHLQDFKPSKLINVSFLPSLVKKQEAAEITYGSMQDGAETIQLATFARGLMFSREAMLNDDLGALNKAIQSAANAAARTERDLIFGVLLSNAAMSDTVPLFHATHGNLGAGALSSATLGTARALMRKQTDSNGGFVLTLPRFIVCPVALETGAESIVAAQSYRTDTAGPETMAPGWQNKLQVIADPRLDVSPTIWYLLSEPNTAPVIELAFLNGQETPTVEQDTDFDRDILKFKIRFDVGAAAAGYAGAVKMA